MSKAPKGFMTITVTEAHLPDLLPGASDPRVPGQLAIGLAQTYPGGVDHSHVASDTSIVGAGVALLTAMTELRAGNMAGNWQSIVYPLADPGRIT